MLMQKVTVKEEVRSWGGQRGIVVTHILGNSAERNNGGGRVIVRIGDQLTGWIECEQLKIGEPYPNCPYGRTRS